MIFAGVFVVAVILLLVFNYRHGDTRSCRWRERRGAGESSWTCVHCGATTTGPRGETPVICLRPKS
ncbi:hypothetical protein LCM08_07335 [Salipiger pacificus]|nr:hypothetical protein [Alloyangia pacifica]MCA0944718.1 hypothetical protein [Alloyangia pacifica]